MIATAVWAVDGEARIRYRCGMLPRFHCWSCKCLLLQRGLLQLLLICVCSCGYIGTSRPVLAATTSVFCDSERGTRGFATAGRFFFSFVFFVVVVVVVVVTSAITSLQKYVVVNSASRFMQLQTQSCRCKGHVCSRKSVLAALQNVRFATTVEFGYRLAVIKRTISYT